MTQPVLAPCPEFPAETALYHLVSTDTWQKAERDVEYFPATYAQDGFIHATADAAVLLNIANHFYRDKPGDWLCLEMTVGSVSDTGVKVLFEPAAPVGETAPDVPGVPSGLLFPHIFGGLRPETVIAVHNVRRDTDGSFLAIANLT